MKFLAIACLSAIALANLDEKAVDKVEKVVHLSLADIPQKISKGYKFFKPHLDQAHQCFKKNAKQIATKAKPHVEKACKQWKQKQKQHIANIKKFKGDVKKFGKSLGSMKDIKLQVVHKYPQGKQTTQQPSTEIKVIPAVEC